MFRLRNFRKYIRRSVPFEIGISHSCRTANLQSYLDLFVYQLGDSLTLEHTSKRSKIITEEI